MKVKKRILTVLLLSMLSMLLTACGGKADDTLSKVEGTLEGNTYLMQNIGMKLVLPERFTMLTGDQLDSKTYGMDAANFYRFVAKDDADKQVLTCFVMPVKKFDAKGYLEATAKQMQERKLRDKIGEITERKIGDFSFQTLISESESEGTRMQEYGLVYEVKGWLVCLDYSYPAADADAAQAELDTIVLPTEGAPAA
ncbi:MAG: hypothetical protein EOM63_01785 [Clostridia bacterium]|nr:hypothetical protein [Clostridia bacterium]